MSQENRDFKQESFDKDYSDIIEEVLAQIGKDNGVEHLSPGEFEEPLTLTTKTHCQESSYDSFDKDFSDINEKFLEDVGKDFGIENLSPAKFDNSNPFPVNGKLVGKLSRWMVPLICKPSGNPDSKTIYVWFVVDLDSHFTYLSKKTLEAFFGQGNVTKPLNSFAIQDQNSEFECRISKGKFESANILGSASLKTLNLLIELDFIKNTCELQIFKDYGAEDLSPAEFGEPITPTKKTQESFERDFSDINEKFLEDIGKDFGIENLSPVKFDNSNPFPVNGKIFGKNSRLMVPLICKPSENPDSKAIYVWFVLDTVSPFTYLTKKTLEAFFGPRNVTNTLNVFAIQDQNSQIECHSSQGEFANILGMNYLKTLRISMEDFDWQTNTFKLCKS